MPPLSPLVLRSAPSKQDSGGRWLGRIPTAGVPRCPGGDATASARALALNGTMEVGGQSHDRRWSKQRLEGNAPEAEPRSRNDTWASIVHVIKLSGGSEECGQRRSRSVGQMREMGSHFNAILSIHPTDADGGDGGHPAKQGR